VEVEVEGGGAPDVAPLGGDGLCAAAFIGAQEGDDLTEDGVREAADVVIFFHGGRRPARESWNQNRVFIQSTRNGHVVLYPSGSIQPSPAH